MRKKIIGIFVCTLLITILIPMTTLSTEIKSKNQSNNLSVDDIYEQKLLEIQKGIKEKNANWTAGYTTVFGPNAEFKPSRCGVIDEKLPEGVNTTFTNSGTAPSEWDWRNVDGKNWMTSIKSQSDCGSCVAFGALGALEAVIQIEKGVTFDCDLSEAFLFFCGGGTCGGGMSLATASQYISSTGVPDELCFPYKSIDSPCENKAQNWMSRVIKASTGRVSGSSIKNALITYGPVLANMDVYADFDTYTGGIYEHVTGDYVAGHAIAIVGYNDNSSYWICKNSWGGGWGENGYFRIKYGNCDIGEEAFYFDHATGDIQPFVPTSPHPANAETNVEPFTINLSWAPSQDLDGDKVYYTVYFSEGTTVYDKDIVANKITTTFFTVKDLKYNTPYSWKIVAEDEHGSQNSGAKWRFTTRLPNKPIINGTLAGKINKKYSYTAMVPDVDSGGTQYYWFFDWGDTTNTGWIGPYNSYNQIRENHSWSQKNQYIIKVWYKLDDVQSEKATLTVSMPCNIIMNTPFIQFLQNHPSLFPILQKIIQR